MNSNQKKFGVYIFLSNFALKNMIYFTLCFIVFGAVLSFKQEINLKE